LSRLFTVAVVALFAVAVTADAGLFGKRRSKSNSCADGSCAVTVEAPAVSVKVDHARPKLPPQPGELKPAPAPEVPTDRAGRPLPRYNRDGSPVVEHKLHDRITIDRSGNPVYLHKADCGCKAANDKDCTCGPNCQCHAHHHKATVQKRVVVETTVESHEYHGHKQKRRLFGGFRLFKGNRGGSCGAGGCN